MAEGDFDFAQVVHQATATAEVGDSPKPVYKLPGWTDSALVWVLPLAALCVAIGVAGESTRGGDGVGFRKRFLQLTASVCRSPVVQTVGGLLLAAMGFSLTGVNRAALFVFGAGCLAAFTVATGRASSESRRQANVNALFAEVSQLDSIMVRDIGLTLNTLVPYFDKPGRLSIARPDPQDVGVLARRWAILGFGVSEVNDRWGPTDRENAVRRAYEEGRPCFSVRPQGKTSPRKRLKPWITTQIALPIVDAQRRDTDPPLRGVLVYEHAEELDEEQQQSIKTSLDGFAAETATLIRRITEGAGQLLAMEAAGETRLGPEDLDWLRLHASPATPGKGAPNAHQP